MSQNQNAKDKTGLLVKDEEGNAYYIRSEILEMCKVTIENQLAGAEIDKKKSATGSLSMDTPKVAEPHAQVIASLKFDERLKSHICVHDNFNFFSNLPLQG